MTENVYQAFEEAAKILGASPDAMGWVQFQYELDREFPEFEEDLPGGFGRRLALFMFAPPDMEKRVEGIVRAAERANEVAEKFRGRRGAT